MFENRGRIIKDGAPLDFAYVPSELINRKTQCDQLESSFRPLFFDGLPCSAYLAGPVGSGKTVTAMHFCREMSEAFRKSGKGMDVISVNCRIRNSEYAVILELVRYFDKGFPDRGFSVDEMMSSFKKHVSSGRHPVVIVLDEVDVLLTGRSINLVYQLTRMSGLDAGASVSLVMISQKPLSALSLDAASMSTFGCACSILFSKYDRADLRAIVDQRCDLALFPGVIDDERKNIIAEGCEARGDARNALEILEKAANLAETKGDDEIKADYIRNAVASVYSDYSENKLLDLDLNRKIVLLSIARCLFNNPEVGISHLEGTYAAACEECGVPAKKHTQFYKYIKDLDSMGLIRTEVRAGPDGGRTTYINIVSIGARALAEKLEEMIEIDRRRSPVEV